MKRIELSLEMIKKVQQKERMCTGCNQCMKQCTLFSSYKMNPKALLKDILKTKSISKDWLYTCCLCGYCERVCKKGVNLKELFYDMRKDVAKNHKAILKKLPTKGIRLHQMSSFSKLFTSDVLGGEKDNVVFFPGCSLMSYDPSLVIKCFDYLKDYVPNLGIYLGCCAKPTHSIGDVEKFSAYSHKLYKDFQKKNIVKVIVACQNCYETLKNSSYPLEVVSLWEVLAQIGVPKNVKNIYSSRHERFAIHDSCPTRKESHIHESVRKILDELGILYEEFKFNKSDTLCCGAGGMLEAFYPHLAHEKMIKRASEVSAEYIISYCQECVVSMRKGGKKSIHILDLLFQKHVYEDFSFEQRSNTTIQKWIHRYDAKKRIMKLRKEKGV